MYFVMLSTIAIPVISKYIASLVDVFGRIFTVAFDDTPEDLPIDVISRLTVGNRLCNHVNDDGEL